MSLTWAGWELEKSCELYSDYHNRISFSEQFSKITGEMISMCGIAGIVDLKKRFVDRVLVQRMCSALIHRGPDDEGYYFNGSAGFGHRRLSIIDITGGHQPLSNEDGTIWIIFNGEIYNFQQLRRELEGLGHCFNTNTDTEAIVHCYEQYGETCIQKLRGMFAFALWDVRTQKLLLARDRVGQKPLFYTWADGKFLFASELQAILQDPAVSREIDLEAIDQYLTYTYIPAPRTAFKNIKKLLPAHYFVLELNSGDNQNPKFRTERYWELKYTPKLQLNMEDACEQLMELLTEAVKLRLISDVPLGAFLSGGIDSSAVVGVMSQLSDIPVKTFSIGFEEESYNELGYACTIAERFGTDHHEFIVKQEALEILPTLVRHYGEPYADSSAIPTFYVAQMTRQHVTVALNGDGGDECFAGYERYLANKMATYYQKLPYLIRERLINLIAAQLPNPLDFRNRLRRIKRFLSAAALPVDERYLYWTSNFLDEHKVTLYSDEFRHEISESDSGQWLKKLFTETEGLDILDASLYVDVFSYLPYDLLVKVDITSMANSLEARSPFLDHHLMEFAARLPANFKLRGRTLKYILKKMLDGFVPHENLHRRKMGFAVPVGQWFRGELREFLMETILSPRALQRGYFKPGALKDFVMAHVNGKLDYSFQIWALLMLELWHQEFIDP